MARRLAPLGARLALLDTQADALEKLRSELGLTEDNCRISICDVSNEDHVDQAFIGTEMVRSMKPEALAKLSAMIPAGRIGEPDEIAQAVQFLVENDFMNGRNLEVDGGMRL
jgi:NAD(P)-dependent dehydrogenase (short-subunit alcohol dehydrogenase family)